MPYVNIKVTQENGGLTKEQKSELIEGATKLLQDKLNKNPETTIVIVEEVDMDNWGIGAEQVSDRRKEGK
ncbi:tautomerase family protein [Texcoconibacillus texcoconensis]|uniref:Tautomerase n=1 Tax=Texcoconibacillus texcoconensis TaxID=1095777 RepID=A0A840QV25_9BACI|nr:4-oxalocrotonate tautomerase family protein [Texcoconibacillus texcoconensis]MBB5175121.1 4-oxalocrotonate tautomerase [Texcoconibacillus texcoconensis]